MVTNEIVKDAHFVTVNFLCRYFEGEPQVMEPDEIIEWRWFGLNELPSPIFLPCEKILDRFFNEELRLINP